MTVDTVANGNGITVHASAKRNADETAARRLAADLCRDDSAVARVVTSVTHYAGVWLDTDSGPAAWTPPEGYAIADVFVSSRGDVHLDIDRVDA